MSQQSWKSFPERRKRGCPILFAHFAKRVGAGGRRHKGGPARPSPPRSPFGRLMTDTLSRYRKVSKALAELADGHAAAITTRRYTLMYRYFVRCASLTSAVLLLVEADILAAAYALEKSLVDALLAGLYIGYVASDREIERLVALAAKGRGTGYSSMNKRAKLLDDEFQRRRPFMDGNMLQGIVKRASEHLNEFGHGGLLSTGLNARNVSRAVEKQVVDRSVFVLVVFMGQVFMQENLDLGPLEALQKELAEIRNEPADEFSVPSL
jgi:Family of unknown function (DUF6988)